MASIPRSSPQIIDGSKAIKASRILIAALIFGVASFALIVELVLGRKAVGHGLPESALLAACGVLLFGGLAASILLPQVVLSGAIKRLAGRPKEEIEPALARTYMTACVLRAAFLEGPALFGVVVVMLTGNATPYLAAGLALLVLLVTFPSRGAFDLLMQRATGRSVFVT